MTGQPTPRFSIAMPAYESAGTIADAVASVLAQTLSDWELVIVDDGSRDDTARVATLAAGGDPRIRVYRHEHRGPGPARGAAVDLTSGPYVCRLDADDLYHPDYLEQMDRFIEEHPGYDIFSCNGERFDADGRRGLMRPAEEGAAGPVESGLEEMLDENRIFSMAILTKDLYERVGGFRERVDVEDYDLWLRAMLIGARHIYNPAVLGSYRLSDRQMTADSVSLTESQLKVLREVCADPRLTARQRQIGRATVRRLQAHVGTRKRADLEARLRSGQMGGARARFIAARHGYSSMPKYAAAGAVMMLSPRLYARAFLSAPADSAPPADGASS